MDSLGQVFEAVSNYFALLSEPMRLRILHSICREEKSVSQIVAETGATQTNVSRHLATMYRSGALSRRKDGNFIYYGVRDSALIEICRTVCTHIAARTDTQAEESSDMLLLAEQWEVRPASEERSASHARSSSQALPASQARSASHEEFR